MEDELRREKKKAGSSTRLDGFPPGFEEELRREKKKASSSTRLDGFPPGQQAPAGTGCCRTLHRQPTQKRVVCATTITTKTN